MEVDMQEIVKSIIRVCEQGGQQVSDVLAAFVAKTVIEKDSTTFALDQEVTPEVTKKVIIKSVERLLERDSPSLETVKMQIDYDTAFQKFDNEAQKIIRVKNKTVSAHKMAIVEVEMDESSDFEALTTLYRKIFRFLLDFAPGSKAISDRSIEREVAAALESVFPRIGLKAFVQLSQEEKGAQLFELARIILGIRLFNKDQGRGGVGLDDIEIESSRIVAQLVQTLDQEVDFFADASAKYQKAIVRSLLERRKYEIDCANETKRLNRLEDAYKADDRNDADDNEATGRPVVAESKTKEFDASQPLLKADLVSTFLIDRWSEELTNRRQYLSFLRILQDDVSGIQEKVTQLCEVIQQEIVTLRSLVGNKASVPKEVVYPRFDSLGSTWVELHQQLTVLRARQSTLEALTKYRLSFSPTLVEKFYTDQPKVERPGDKAGDKSDASAASIKAQEAIKAEESEWKAFQALMEPQQVALLESFDPNPPDAQATLLTSENTADFMLLPLELQGFCPWTMVHARGLLVPGKPNLGVVRYDNMYFVCDHDAGLRAFISNPTKYLDAIKEKAMNSPEYIFLLRMQRWFPSASIHRILDQQGADGMASTAAEGKPGFGGKPSCKDASTDTPVHFVERYIDNNYHWNEWELRRRARQIVNLRNCVTTSQQTDSSHFRRDTETQVYEARTHDTQTRREKGTNPPIVTTYMTGLRGKTDPMAVSKYVRDPARESKADSKDAKGAKGTPTLAGARIVSLTLDL